MITNKGCSVLFLKTPRLSRHSSSPLRKIWVYSGKEEIFSHNTFRGGLTGYSLYPLSTQVLSSERIYTNTRSKSALTETLPSETHIVLSPCIACRCPKKRNLRSSALLSASAFRNSL